MKSFILSITHKPFFLKFHMGNEEKLQDLINKTETWNIQRGISNNEGALMFDVYLDRINFDLYAEIDRENEKLNDGTGAINPGAGDEFKYVTLTNLNG